MEKISLRVKNDRYSLEVLRWLKLHIGRINSAGVFIQLQTESSGVSPALYDGPSEIVGSSAIIAALSGLFENFDGQSSGERQNGSRGKPGSRKNSSTSPADDCDDLQNFMMGECYTDKEKKEPNLDQEKDENSALTKKIQSGGKGEELPAQSGDEYDDLMMKAWAENN